MKAWIKKHPQLLLAGVQVTLAQMGTWDFMPPKVVLVCNAIAGLVQAWLALFYSSKDKSSEDQ